MSCCIQCGYACKITKTSKITSDFAILCSWRRSTYSLFGRGMNTWGSSTTRSAVPWCFHVHCISQCMALLWHSGLQQILWSPLNQGPQANGKGLVPGNFINPSWICSNYHTLLNIFSEFLIIHSSGNKRRES